METSTDPVIQQAIATGDIKPPEQPPAQPPETEPPPVDVEGIMRAAAAVPSPSPILSAPVQGPGTEQGGAQGTKRGRKKKEEPPPPDPLIELLKQAKFGDMAVAAQSLFFQACEAPALTPEEAANTNAATVGLAHYLLKGAKTPEQLVPVVAFCMAMIMPIIPRAQPIGKATAPFMRSAVDWIGAQWKNMSDALKERFSTAKPPDNAN